jgi:SOS-response transcriptional repressor LexA
MPDGGMDGLNIKKGDVVFIRFQDGISNGDIAAVIADGSLAVRQVTEKNGTVALIPRSNSGGYVPECRNKQNVRLIGKAVSCYVSL